ncbi:unnamed protein product [Discosporangium mesarthrocarpum]
MESVVTKRTGLALALCISSVWAFHPTLRVISSTGANALVGPNPWVSRAHRGHRVYDNARRAVRSRSRVTGALRMEFDTVQEYDQFLGELVFSQADVRDDVLKNLEKASDEGFQTWLKEKILNCEDLEEKGGLQSLQEIITQIQDKVDEAILAQEEEDSRKAAEQAKSSDGPEAVDVEVATVAEARSAPQVWEEMRRLQRLGDEAIDVDGAEAVRQARMSPFDGLPDKVRASYEELLSGLLNRPAEKTLAQAVEESYHKCDIQFMTLIKQKIENASGTEEAQVLQDVVDCIGDAMKARMSKATERLQRILSAGSPKDMENKVRYMSQDGEIDDALVLLIQANVDQAVAAGATQPAEVLKKLAATVQEEMDSKVEPQKRLLRQLLRTPEKKERLKILNEAFRQRAKVAMADGSESNTKPEVEPPQFLEVVRTLLSKFGNVGESEVQFAEKMDEIILEAEQVATELYGESQTPQDLQDRAWKDKSVSVFDLETMEEEARMKGEEMPWQNEKYDHMMPEDIIREKRFNAQKGELDIGGG